MIVDSDLIVLASKPVNAEVRTWVVQHRASISAITRVEVLGCRDWKDSERILDVILERLSAIPITDPILDEAIRLKQLKKMSLGDSIIAGTAILNGGELATRNLRDFQNITGLIARDPTRPADPSGTL
jgi:predicted nucleic acid-binding protein